MNQPVPPHNNPSSNIEQHLNNSDVDGGIQAIHGDNNKQVQIINYYYREAIKTIAAESADTDNENLPCPYRGLFHFGPDDAEFFFGREVFVEELFGATQTRNFIPVLGASGSGKSSVVLAGLVPRLQQEGNWLFTHFRPGSEPFHALALALVPLYTPNLNATERIAQARQLANYLREGTISLADVFAQIHQNQQNFRVLLIADQFEELYTLCTDGKIRRSFLDVLLASFHLSNSQSQQNNVLIATMRADFLGNALSYPKFGDLLQNSDIKIRSMNHEELEEVIIKPADKSGVSFEAGLVKRILDDVKDEPGNLPLLEFALTQLWKRRTGKQLTHVAYEEIGEVEGALARHADENYRKLSEVEREQVRRIFIQLVRPGEGTEDTRRLATKAELNQANWGLVKHLADARLVVTSQNAANQETVEVVHEALIRNWGELRQWMDTDREFRAWQERLRVGMYQWEEMQRDEGILLRGAALADAEEKLKLRRDDVAQGEKDFIQASIALRDRERKRRERSRLFTISGLTLVAAISLFFGGVSWWRLDANEKNANLIAQNTNVKGLWLRNVNQLQALKEGIELGKKLLHESKATPETRMRVVALLREIVYDIKELNSLGKHGDSVTSVAFSPDGNIIASASGDKTVKLWNLQGQVIQTLKGHGSGVNSVAFSPDVNIIASASGDKTVKLWNLQGQVIQTLKGHGSGVNSVAFSPDGNTIATASRDNTVKLWNLQGQVIQTLTGHGDAVTSVVFSPDGNTIATASGDKTVKLWNLQGQEIKTLQGHGGMVYSVAFSPDGNTIVSASSGDNTVKLWNLQGQEIKTLIGHGSPVLSVTFSPDSNTIATASWDNTVKLWNLQGQEIKTLIGHSEGVTSVIFSSDGNTIATTSNDKTVKLWNLHGQEIKFLTGHGDRVNSVVFNPNGKTIATASGDKTVKLWNSQGQMIQTLTGHSDRVNSVAFSPDSNTIASASGDKTVKLWNSQGQEIQTLSGHGDRVWGVAFSPDGKTIATASGDKTVKLWNLQGQEIQTLTGHSDWVYSVAFSPDGKTIASASADRTVKLWNLQGQEIQTFTGHGSRIYNAVFNPEGNTIASASLDKTVKLWNLQGQEIKTLAGHGEGAYRVIFSPDGKTIATASLDKTMKLWNLQGQEIQTFTGHGGRVNKVNSVAFSPDGKTIASASRDGTVKLWNFDLDDLLVRGCNWARDYLKHNANLSEEDRRMCDGIGN